MEWISIKERIPEFVNKYEGVNHYDKEVVEIESVSENVLCLMLPIGRETNLMDRCPTIGNFRKIEYFRINDNGEKVKILNDEDYTDEYYFWIEFQDTHITTNEKGVPFFYDGIQVTHWAVVPKFPELKDRIESVFEG